MKELLRGELGIFGILIELLLVVLLGFVVYEAWFAEHTAVPAKTQAATETPMDTVSEKVDSAFKTEINRLPSNTQPSAGPQPQETK